MRKYGGFIPGIRSGRPTADHIDGILTRLTLIGALYLAAVSVLPELLLVGIQVEALPLIGTWLSDMTPDFIETRRRHQLLLRRHLAADRGRRGDGLRAAGRKPAGDAQLRRLPQEGPHPGPPWLRNDVVFSRSAEVPARAPRRSAWRLCSGCRRFRPGTCCAPGGGRPAASWVSGSRGMLASGQLVGDELMAEVVTARLAQADAREGFLLDGYPRTLPQAATLARASCARPGRGARPRPAGGGAGRRAGAARPSAAAAVDDTGSRWCANACGSTAIKPRPLVDYFRRQGLLREIDGNQSDRGRSNAPSVRRSGQAWPA